MFTIRLAGIDIAIDNRYDRVRRQCAGFMSEGAPLFTVGATEEEIREEWETSLPEVRASYPDPEGYGESVCVYRKICHRMPLYGVLLLHSAAVETGGKAYLFSAPSGTGKTTHLRLWMQTHPGQVRIINGDKPLLRREEDGRFTVHGTPWAGKEGWHSNASAPLDGLCFLARARCNTIRPMALNEAREAIMRQILYPRDPEPLIKTLELTNALLSAAPVYLLSCNISEEAARLSYDTMVSRASGNQQN